MYNFQKLANEEILLITDESILKKDEEEIEISTIITNQRLILLDYPKKSNNYEEALRTSRGAEYLKQKEPVLVVNIDEIKEVVEVNKFDQYILKSGNYFLLNDTLVKTKVKGLL